MLVESTSESINQGFYSAQMDRNAVNHWVWSSIKKGFGLVTSCLLNFFKGAD